jgi:hypothetical protein
MSWKKCDDLKVRYHNDDIENEIPLTRPPVYYNDEIETETSTQIKEKHFIITVAIMAL